MTCLVIITRLDSKFDGVGSFVKLRLAHTSRKPVIDWLQPCTRSGLGIVDS